MVKSNNHFILLGLVLLLLLIIFLYKRQEQKQEGFLFALLKPLGITLGLTLGLTNNSKDSRDFKKSLESEKQRNPGWEKNPNFMTQFILQWTKKNCAEKGAKCNKLYGKGRGKRKNKRYNKCVERTKKNYGEQCRQVEWFKFR